jgi:nicotinamidase-related amidase
MKLPATNRKRALIVIDLQSAFMKPHNQHIISNIFHTEKGSLWDTQQDFTAPVDESTKTLDAIMSVLQPHNPLHVLKETRSVFKGDQNIEVYLKEHGIEEVHLVGTETNDCVLATAYDAFAAGYPVYVLEECVESGTPGRHEVGLKVLRWQSMTNNSCLAKTTEVDIASSQPQK